MKPILATDLAGSLLKNEVVIKAHNEWFEVMAMLLKDDSVKSYANKPDFYKHVYEVMEKYVGIKDKKMMNLFARTIFEMSWLAAVKEDSYHKDYADFLRSIKDKFRIYLVTGTPEQIIKPVLKKIDCEDLFDEIITVKMTEEPDKDALLKGMKEKPMFYVTESKNAIKVCRELGIKIIIASWDKKQPWEKEVRETPDYKVKNIAELEKIINQATQ